MRYDNLDKSLVLKIAEDYNLAITLKQDGTIMGLSTDLAKLRRVYEIRTKAPSKSVAARLEVQTNGKA